MNIISKLYILLSSIVLAIGISGCNTIEGAGEDIQAAGEKIEEEAED